MKKILFAVLMIVGIAVAVPAHAIEPALSEKVGPGGVSGAEEGKDIKILEVKDIQALDEAKLVDAYMDIIVELEASKTFHSTSGFTPKEYQRYKDLLKYRLQLIFEIHRRKVEVPAEVK